MSVLFANDTRRFSEYGNMRNLCASFFRFMAGTSPCSSTLSQRFLLFVLELLGQVQEGREDGPRLLSPVIRQKAESTQEQAVTFPPKLMATAQDLFLDRNVHFFFL